MISDTGLAALANWLGGVAMVLIVGYHVSPCPGSCWPLAPPLRFLCSLVFLLVLLCIRFLAVHARTSPPPTLQPLQPLDGSPLDRLCSDRNHLADLLVHLQLLAVNVRAQEEDRAQLQG